MTIWKRHICGLWVRRLNRNPEPNAFLSRKKAEIVSKIASLTKQLAMIDQYLADPESSLEMPVLIKTIPSVIVSSMERRIETYDALFDLMPEMGAEMERLGCECAIPEYCFTHYLEPGYKEEQVLAACIYHKGSYGDFPRTYASVLKYIEENEYEICGSIREKYIDGVWNKDREEDWLSEIQIPVRKKISNYVR